MKKKSNVKMWILVGVLGVLGFFLYFRARAAKFDSPEVQGAIEDKAFFDSLDDRGKTLYVSATITQDDAQQIADVTKEKLSANLFNWRSKQDKKEVEVMASKIKNYSDLYLVQEKFGYFNGRDYLGTLVRFIDSDSAVVQKLLKYASEY